MKTQKPPVNIVILLFLTALILCNPLQVSAQAGVHNQSVIQETSIKTHLLEAELAFFGAGFKYFNKTGKFSRGFGINFRYLYFSLATNNQDLKEYADHERPYTVDFYKFNYIFRFSTLKLVNIDFSPFVALSFHPQRGDEGPSFFSYGLTTELSILKSHRFGLSTAFILNKDFRRAEYYLSWQPIKLLIRFGKQFKHQKSST